MPLKVGDKAPTFTLFANDKSQVSLDAYRGKRVVLYFFPFAFSGVCTDELCTVRDEIKSYSRLGAKVLGISVDSIYALDAFSKAEGLGFPLLSDFNKQVCRAYDAFYEDFPFDYHGVSRRASFVIDAEGVIQYAEVLESAGDLPNFAEVKAVLKRLKKK